LRWAVVRIAVLCGLFREHRARAELHDWSHTFMYSLYSHLTCSASPVQLVVIPSVWNSFPASWPQQLGLSVVPSTERPESITVLACGQPLVRLQSLMRSFVENAAPAGSYAKLAAVKALLSHAVHIVPH
jgi:hypothetical protein